MTTTETTQAPPATDPTGVIQQLYEAFGRGDLDSMLALIHEDVDWTLQVDAPGGELVPMFQNGRGHDAVRNYFGGVAQMDIHEFSPSHFWVDGNIVLVELVIDFTHRSTGKHARLDEIHRFTLDDAGKIVRYRPYADTAAFIDAFS